MLFRSEVADFTAINEALYGKGPRSESLLKDIEERYPGVRLVKGGEAKDWEETKTSLLGGIILVLFVIYALLAIPFKSYLQPLIVMVVVPFGIGGAILGHLMTMQTLSLLSMLGIIALSGVVVNDSLVLVDFINKQASGDDCPRICQEFPPDGRGLILRQFRPAVKQFWGKGFL